MLEYVVRSGDGTPPHDNAAAYGDEVSVPDLECSNGNSDWWYMYTSTMLINNGDPCVQRECAAETDLLRSRQSLCAEGSMYEDRYSRTFWVITSLHQRFRSQGLDS
jgi:hypothetical protein